MWPFTSFHKCPLLIQCIYKIKFVFKRQSIIIWWDFISFHFQSVPHFMDHSQKLRMTSLLFTSHTGISRATLGMVMGCLILAHRHGFPAEAGWETSIQFSDLRGPTYVKTATLDNDRKDLGHLWLGYIKKSPNPGTLTNKCSLYRFW